MNIQLGKKLDKLSYNFSVNHNYSNIKQYKYMYTAICCQLLTTGSLFRTWSHDENFNTEIFYSQYIKNQ